MAASLPRRTAGEASSRPSGRRSTARTPRPAIGAGSGWTSPSLIHASVLASVLTSLGTALDVDGQRDEARRCFEDALRLDPDYSYAHYHLALALMKEKCGGPYNIVREGEAKGRTRMTSPVEGAQEIVQERRWGIQFQCK